MRTNAAPRRLVRRQIVPPQPISQPRSRGAQVELPRVVEQGRRAIQLYLTEAAKGRLAAWRRAKARFVGAGVTKLSAADRAALRRARMRHLLRCAVSAFGTISGTPSRRAG